MSAKNNRFTDIASEYTGAVTFKYLVKNKIIEIKAHNNGLSSLFKIIAKCLAGYSTVNEVPVKIDLRYSTDTTNYQTCLNNTILLSSRRYDTDGTNWSAYYTSVITSADIQADAISNLRTYRLYLMSSTDDMAYVTVEYNNLSSIELGAQALVEWKLTTTNPS